METAQIRKRMPVSALFDPKIVLPAIGSAFVKLNPRSLMKNPVMFVLEVVTALTTVILIRDLGSAVMFLKNLVGLNLHENPIGDDGARALFEGTTLEKLKSCA